MCYFLSTHVCIQYFARPIRSDYLLRLFVGSRYLFVRVCIARLGLVSCSRRLYSPCETNANVCPLDSDTPSFHVRNVSRVSVSFPHSTRPLHLAHACSLIIILVETPVQNKLVEPIAYRDPNCAFWKFHTVDTLPWVLFGVLYRTSRSWAYQYPGS